MFPLLLILISIIMSVEFKPTPKRNPQNITAEPLFYATAVSNHKTGIDELSGRVSDSSTVSRADTYAVIISLLETIIKEFKAGNTVELGKLGRFSISLQSEGVPTPEELSSNHIKGAKINFRPGVELKEMLASLSYSKT